MAANFPQAFFLIFVTHERKGEGEKGDDKSYFCQLRASISQTEENPVQNTAVRISKLWV